ncbi:MAG TPA: nucleotidyltransferase family protein [Gemmatimonadaceae bacterium]
MTKSVAQDIAAIVLAAGGSTRFGSPKQLLTYDGENLVRRATRSAIDAGISKVIVVLGAHADEVRMHLAGLENLTSIVNTEWAAGQASSLSAGIDAAASTGIIGALIMLADQPLVTSDSLERLLTRFAGPSSVVVSRYDEILGVPAVFGSEYFDLLRTIEGDIGAGQWIRRHRELVTAVDMHEAEVDIDTVDDLDRIRPDRIAE